MPVFLVATLAVWTGALFGQTANQAPEILARFATGADGERVMISRVSISADGSRAAVELYSSADMTVTTLLYDAKTGTALDEPTRLFGALPRSLVAFSPDGMIAAATAADQTSLEVVSLATGRSIYSYKASGYTAPAFMPDGRLIHKLARRSQTPSREKDLGIVDLATGQIVARFTLGEYQNIKTFSPDGKLMLVEDANSSQLQILNLPSGSLSCELEMAKNDHQRAITYLPNTGTIVGANYEGVIQTWDARNGKRLSRIEPNQPLTSRDSMAFTPDAKMLLIHAGALLEVRDTATAKQLGFIRMSNDARALPYFPTLRDNSLLVAEKDTRAGDLLRVRLAVGGA